MKAMRMPGPVNKYRAMTGSYPPQHRSSYWWACPACLEARTHDADDYVREWAIRQLKYLIEGKPRP